MSRKGGMLLVAFFLPGPQRPDFPVVVDLLRKGNKARATASTLMNDRSSRCAVRSSELGASSDAHEKHGGGCLVVSFP